MRILVAEDDREASQFIERGLTELGHNVVIAETGTDALHYIVTETFDVAVIDRMLPHIDGLSLVRRARAAAIDVPVLMLTALGRIEDRVDGLEAGSDDYLVKPFAFSELSARINALGRRKPLQAAPTVLSHGGIVLDLSTREVTRDGERVLLQPREFRLLQELMSNAGRIVTRTMFLEQVWNYHFDPQTNIVETHISRLRTKLNQAGKPDLIETVRGAGYRLRDHG